MNPLDSAPAVIPVVPAIGGSIIGAFSSTLSTWIIQRRRERLEFVERSVSQLEALYSDFINESARLLVDAAQHSLEEPNTLVSIYALLSRIRLNSSPQVIESAERLLEIIVKIYFEPNLTPHDIRHAASKHNDHLQEFSLTCRRDLESLRQRL